MTTTAEHRAVEQESGASGTWWPLIATVFLVGIGLVSLADSLTGEASERDFPVFPEQMGHAPVIVIAPGAEQLLAELPSLERVTLLPAWERLPEIGEPFYVITSQSELPRLPDGWQPVDQSEELGWRITLVNPPEHSVQAHSYDVSEHLSEANIFYQPEDGPTAHCDRWILRRWECGLESWHWIGVTEVVMQDRNRRCIWAHPATGYDLVIQFSNVPLGTQLAGRYGLSDTVIDYTDLPPVQFEARVGSASRSYTVGSRRGFHSYQLAPDPTDTGPVDVEFIISAEHDGLRHFCFTAVMQDINDGTQPPGQPMEMPSEAVQPIEVEFVPVPLERENREGSGP